MVFLLDTSVASALMREDNRAIDWISTLRPADRVVISSVVRGEIRFGIAKIPEGRRKEALEASAEELFAALDCEPISPAVADRYATLKLNQRSKGMVLDENDLWIAATALAVGATLVSNDQDFQRVDGLAVVTP